jgi:hypothetical protein
LSSAHSRIRGNLVKKKVSEQNWEKNDEVNKPNFLPSSSLIKSCGSFLEATKSTWSEKKQSDWLVQKIWWWNWQNKKTWKPDSLSSLSLKLN